MQVLSEGKSTFNSIFRGKKSRQIFTHDTFLKMNPYRINYKALKEDPVKTTPENVKEANENLFRAKWNLPQAAKHCGMSHKEMKLTFFEFLKYNPVTYQA
jgi:transcriptional regulator with AAA-type ATPase domain